MYKTVVFTGFGSEVAENKLNDFLNEENIRKSDIVSVSHTTIWVAFNEIYYSVLLVYLESEE